MRHGRLCAMRLLTFFANGECDLTRLNVSCVITPLWIQHEAVPLVLCVLARHGSAPLLLQILTLHEMALHAGTKRYRCSCRFFSSTAQCRCSFTSVPGAKRCRCSRVILPGVLESVDDRQWSLFSNTPPDTHRSTEKTYLRGSPPPHPLSLARSGGDLVACARRQARRAPRWILLNTQGS